MKKLLLITTIISCQLALAQSTSKIKIGNFIYSVREKKEYTHDDNLNCLFFIISRNKKKMCSGYKYATRNDSTFYKGDYLIKNNSLVIRTYYYYQGATPFAKDSDYIFFTTNKSGNLIMKKFVDYYKNGKIDTTRIK